MNNELQNYLNKINKVNLLMLAISLLAIISFIAIGEWHGAIWAFNTLIWCGIASSLEIENNELKDKLNQRN